MKNSLFILLIAGMIFSCKSPEKQNSEIQKAESADSNETASQKLQEQFVPIESEEALIATALLAAPQESRDSCKIIGYNSQGELITYREGNNQFIVLADDPQKAGFSAAAYHKSLEAFMARGRELKAEGKSRDEIFEIRGSEIKSGKLKMGNAGSTLHIYYGAEQAYNPKTAEVKGAKYRYVVYLPYATAESTGLPIQPLASNHPWIMDPGTHRAHIMISPLSNSRGE